MCHKKRERERDLKLSVLVCLGFISTVFKKLFSVADSDHTGINSALAFHSLFVGHSRGAYDPVFDMDG